MPRSQITLVIACALTLLPGLAARAGASSNASPASASNKQQQHRKLNLGLQPQATPSVAPEHEDANGDDNDRYLASVAEQIRSQIGIFAHQCHHSESFDPIRFELKVEPTGKVADLHPDSSEPFAQCLAGKLKSIDWPKPRGGKPFSTEFTLGGR